MRQPPKGDPIRRAHVAYAAACARDGIIADQPHDSSTMESLDGLDYVVLRSEFGAIIAVYRVDRQGVLKRLKRWPAALEGRP